MSSCSNNLYCYYNRNLLYKNVTLLYLEKELKINKQKILNYMNSKLYKKYYISFRELNDYELELIYKNNSQNKKRSEMFILKIFNLSLLCKLNKHNLNI
jgi:hypothetical protein